MAVVGRGLHVVSSFPAPTGASSGTAYTDSATVGLVLTPSAVENAQFVDAATVTNTLTPSAVEAAQFVDSATVGLVLTPSAVETAQYVDAATTPLKLTPSSSDTAQYVDSATVTNVLTPSGADTAQFVDSATVGLVLTPSTTVELHEISDAATIPLALTPSGSDLYPQGDAVTVTVALTPGPAPLIVVNDTASRTITAGALTSWGTADSGQTWQLGGGYINNSGTYGADGSNLTTQLTTNTTHKSQTIDGGLGPDVLVLAKVKVDALPTGTGGVVRPGVYFRVQDASNWYFATAQINTTGGVVARVNSRIAGTDSTVMTVSATDTYVAGDYWWVKAGAIDDFIVIKVWKDGTTEPDSWTITTHDSSISSAGRVGAGGHGNGSQTNNILVSISDFQAGPMSAETLQAVDAGTVTLALTPSAVENAQFVDSATVRTTLTVSATEAAQFADSATVTAKLSPSSTDVAAYIEAATVPLALSPSVTEARTSTDAGTHTLTLTPSGTETKVIDLTDAAQANLLLTPSAVEVPVPGDAGLAAVNIVPSALYEWQGDGAVVPLAISGSVVEFKFFEEAPTIPLTLTPSAAENVSTTTAVTVYLDLLPSADELAETVEAAIVSLLLTPGVVIEQRQIADYLLEGVLSGKWAAALRDNTYTGSLFDTRYTVLLDTNWHMHWRGRGDE